MAEHFFTRNDSLLGIFLMFIVAGCATTRSSQDYAPSLANAERPATERELDGARKPSEVLAFYGVKRGDKVADVYDEEVAVLVEGLINLLEPLMVVILGLIVGFIVIALFMPLIKLLNDLS